MLVTVPVDIPVLCLSKVQIATTTPLYSKRCYYRHYCVIVFDFNIERFCGESICVCRSVVGSRSKKNWNRSGMSWSHDGEGYRRDDGDSKHFWNVDKYLQNYAAQFPEGSHLEISVSSLEWGLYKIRLRNWCCSHVVSEVPTLYCFRPPPPPKCFINFAPLSTRINSNEQIWQISDYNILF
jgi:hypothetical protein